MKKYENMYLGVVVQNNDPEYRGRVKIWVPHINASVYEKWNQAKVDRKFKFPGKNIESDLSLIINELKDLLPWAEYCSPLAGEISSGSYNAFDDKASTSDATYPYSLSGSNFTPTVSALTLNPDKMGEKPGSVYEKYSTKLVDAFTDTTANKTKTINPNGAEYRPSTYSNAAKGLFSIPNVGAHVWVFFRDGMPMYPVYMGAAFGTDDFKTIFQTEDDAYQDYPQTFENLNSRIRSKDVNTSTYRNKLVLNQRGAALEIINTTDRERFKITHFAGGFLELNNKYNSLFSPKNLQLLTVKDKFETVRGNNNHFVGRDSDNIIQGDYLLKVGNLNKTALDEWVEAYTAIADLLSLPEGEGNKDNLADTVEQQAQALAAAEAKLGFGGNFIETITKHKFVNVGLVFNSFASTRYNLTDKTVSKVRNVISSGTELQTEDIPLIEYTHIDDMPGGNYNVSVGNRYSLLVGSGGIDIKTTGPVNLGGTIMALAGKQVNIASSDDTNIDGGTNLSVIAEIMTIRTRNRQQVVVDDNLGVSRNVVIGGGAYINGETYLQHVTAPYEFQVTESTTITDSGGWEITGTLTGTSTPASTTSPWGIQIRNVTLRGGVLKIVQPHTHYFKNLPLTLLQSPEAVRNQAANAVNGGKEAAAAAIPATHYNTAGGNLNDNPNGPRNGVPG